MHGIDRSRLSYGQLEAVSALTGEAFEHRWALADALSERSDAWRRLPATTVNKLHNRELQRELDYLYQHFDSRE